MKLTPQKQAKFVNAKPRPELDGKLGLDLHEIAESLNAEFANVKRRFITLFEKKRLFGLPIGRTNEISGLSVESFVLPLKDARLLVMQYQNAVGFGYCEFLLNRDEQLSETETLMNQISAPMRALLKLELDILKATGEQHKMFAHLAQVDNKVKVVQTDVKQITTIMSDSPLTVPQQKEIVALANVMAETLWPGDKKKYGTPLGMLKRKFEVLGTRQTFKDIRQCDFEAAIAQLKYWTANGIK